MKINNVRTDMWMVKMEMPYNKREMMYIMFDALGIPYNIAHRNIPRYRVPYSHMGMWWRTSTELIVYGMGSWDYPIKEGSVEISIDELLEILAKTIEEETI